MFLLVSLHVLVVCLNMLVSNMTITAYTMAIYNLVYNFF